MARKIVFYKNYFLDFYESRTEKIKEKIDYILDLIATVERVPEKFLKHLEETDALYEIRIKHGSDIYRVFCCFDEGKLIVLFNGFQKKSNKTPKSEIKKAETIKQEYFNEKWAR